VSEFPTNRNGPAKQLGNVPAPGDLPILKDARSRAKWCADTACTILETDPAWAGVLAYDEFRGLYSLLKPIPGTTVPRSTFSPSPMADTDTTAAVRWFNRTILLRGIAPSQPIAIDEYYATQNTPIINARFAMALGEEVAGAPFARPSARKDCSWVGLLAETESHQQSKFNAS